MASAASAWNHAILRPRSATARPLPSSPHLPIWNSRRLTPAATLRVSAQPQGGGRGGEEEGGGGSMGSIDISRLLSDDFSYLWKLTAGSVGGASAIKYGSVLYPDMTRPNLVQALLMVSLPVLVAVLILVKGSRKEPLDEDLL